VRQNKQYLHASRILSAKKGAEHKDSLKPEPAEYAKSGSDSGAAQSDTAFDPNQTAPEEEGDGGPEQNSGNLDMSPGNTKASMPRDPQEGGAEKAPDQQDRERTSGAGGARKDGNGPR